MNMPRYVMAGAITPKIANAAHAYTRRRSFACHAIQPNTIAIANAGENGPPFVVGETETDYVRS